MNKRTLLLQFVAFIIIFLSACSKNNSQTTPPVDPGTAAINVYPQPPSKWMETNGVSYYSAGFVGDVMPYYDNGKFHIFFLHDARDGKAGFHPIHKYVTADLINYDYQGLMVNYAGKEDQDLAIGTGSVVKVGNTWYCYYTGHNYLFPASGKPKEGIMYATSTDLKTWTKKSGFNMTAPTGYDRNEFRDPHVFFNSEMNEYWMLVSTRTNNKAVIALFTTTDPVSDNWKLKDPLFITDDDAYFILECADVFKWGNKWYMFFSENNKERTTHYRMASSSGGPWIKPARDVIDGEYFYASKTASDGTNRYAFGWTATKGNKADAGNKEWAGNMVTHQLKQEADGSLSAVIPVNVDQLFKKQKTFNQVSSTGGVSNVSNSFKLNTGAQVLFDRISGQKKITATISNIQSASEFGLIVGAGNISTTDQYRFSFIEAEDKVIVQRINGGVTYDEAKVPIKIDPGNPISIKMVIDNSVCVLYINGSIALSSRIYSASNSYWGLYSSTGNIEFNETSLFEY